MLTLAGNFVTRQDDLTALPVRVLRYLLADEVLELASELCHEIGAGSDAVAVKGVLLGQLLALADGPFTSLLGVEGGTKAAGSLLVHLSSRGHTIDGHEKELFRLDFSEEMFDIVEYPDEHFFLAQSKRGVGSVFMSAIMDNAIHVQLQRSAGRPLEARGGGSAEDWAGARIDCRIQVFDSRQ